MRLCRCCDGVGLPGGLICYYRVMGRFAAWPDSFLRFWVMNATYLDYRGGLALFGAAGQSDGADGFSAFMRTSHAT